METTYAEPQLFEQRSEGDRHYIEGICVPYGRVTTRVGPTPEVFERGAFADLVASARKVKLTDYNHSHQRVPVGYSEEFQDRDAGLWCRFRLNRTPEGESARANATEGVYQGLSVGFIARQHEMRSGVRHVTSARLDHVSLVEDPAYLEAEILAVRGAQPWREAYSWVLESRPEILGIDSAPPQGFAIAIARIRSRRA
jgi:HK97 family phage prohead protease